MIKKLKEWFRKDHHRIGDKSDDFGDRIVYFTGDGFKVLIQRLGTKTAGDFKFYSKRQIDDADENELERIVNEVFAL